jgi:hypothetical protein
MLETIPAIDTSIIANYRVIKVLGKGSEGIVYLVEDKDRANKLVLKLFHEPHSRDWFTGLSAYADNISSNELGLPVTQLLYQKADIIGLVYPYVQLYTLHWRIFNIFDKVAMSVVGSYCRKQYYLMTKHGLAIYDPVLLNLMVDKQGRWHYLDIGGGICLLNDPWIRKLGAIGYGFASMLLSIYNVTLHHYIKYQEFYTYDATCFYCSCKWLNDIAERHLWVKGILSEIKTQKSTIFYDPEFYKRLSDRLPGRVPCSFLILPFSKTLTNVGKLRGYMHL